MKGSSHIIKSGKFLVFRQGIGVIISVANLIFVAKIIGPSEYGIFVAFSSVSAYLFSIALLGSNIFLVRQSERSIADYAGSARSMSILLISVMVIVYTLFQSYISEYLNIENFITLSILMFIAVLFQSLSAIELALRDRNMDFKASAVFEVSSQLINLSASLILINFFKGSVALMMAYCISQLSIFSMLIFRQSFKGNFLVLRFDLMINLFMNGIKYSSAMLIWQTKSLVVAILILPLLGKEIAGIIALSIRLGDVLSFAKTATYRIAIAAMPKIARNSKDVGRAIEEGGFLQILAIGVPLSTAAVILSLMPREVIPGQWMDALKILPFISLGLIINAIFNLHSAFLFYKADFISVGLFHLIFVSIFYSSIYFTYPTLGIYSYGAAELLSLVSYVVLILVMRKYSIEINYKTVILMSFAFICVFFVNYGGYFMMIPLIASLANPLVRMKVKSYAEKISEK